MDTKTEVVMMQIWTIMLRLMSKKTKTFAVFVFWSLEIHQFTSTQWCSLCPRVSVKVHWVRLQHNNHSEFCTQTQRGHGLTWASQHSCNLEMKTSHCYRNGYEQVKAWSERSHSEWQETKFRKLQSYDFVADSWANKYHASLHIRF